MGCCISKCKPKTKPHLNPNVQDKLVISQAPPSPPPSPPQKRKTVQSPPSITSASFTCSTQSRSTCGSSSLSSASSASSVAFSKVERSFSNDFLQSCAKENPQKITSHPIKQILEVKQLVPGTAQKRARATSPILKRQKSFRVEKERSSTMRSPSPSRRFNYQRPPMVFSTNRHNESNHLNTRPASPTRNMIKDRPTYLKNKLERFNSQEVPSSFHKLERFGYEIDSKVECVEVGQVLSKVNYSGPVATEDIDNPHIALDCFIFL